MHPFHERNAYDLKKKTSSLFLFKRFVCFVFVRTVKVVPTAAPLTFPVSIMAAITPEFKPVNKKKNEFTPLKIVIYGILYHEAADKFLGKEPKASLYINFYF